MTKYATVTGALDAFVRNSVIVPAAGSRPSLSNVSAPDWSVASTFVLDVMATPGLR
jgi:hypothetical protein